MTGQSQAKLNEAEAAALMRPVNGTGGFQDVLRGLQNSFDRGTMTITLTAEQVEKINRYASKYGTGGFEDRLDGVRRSLPTLFP